MTRTYSQIHCTGKYSEHSSILWWVWPNGWVFIDKLSGAAFKSTCNHLNLKFRACFEQGVPWHSRNYRVFIHFQGRTWHDQNIQANGLSRWVIRTKLSHLVSEVNWLSVCLRTKWFWVRVQLQSLKLQISRLLWTRNSLKIKHLQSANSLWNLYVTWQEQTVK